MKYSIVYFQAKDHYEYNIFLHNLSLSDFHHKGVSKYYAHFPGVSYGVEISGATHTEIMRRMENMDGDN